MKYMKLGSKPDSFHSGDDNVRFAKTEFATDLIVSVGDAKFYLHKFPLLSKSARLQKLVSMINDQNSGEIHLQDVPGGPSAFEICAKYCYGMEVTLNAYNVVAARCAAEYLEMYDTVEKGNLIYKIEVFLNSSIFRSWKDSIIVLQTTKSLIAWCEELKLISRAIDSIALMACIDTSKVDWSYTYNRKKLPSENGDEPLCNIRKPHSVPADWWVEDLCELPINLYKRVITTIKTHGVVSGNIIAEALHAYASRRLPGFSKAMVQSTDITKYRSLAETISWLLPKEKGSVPCYFLLKLLKAAILLDCGEMERNELMRRSAEELYQATVADLLVHAPAGETMMYDVDIVQSLVEQFVAHEQNANSSDSMHNELDESTSPICGSDYSRLLVTKLIEGYLAEVSKDPNLPLSKFVNLAEKVSNFPRSSHDGLYRAIDMYLKVHPGISKSERKRICRLMDCRKLSVEACTHAVQNERLPLRVVVQVLYFEQARQATSFTGNKMPEPHGSSRSITTIHDEDWNGMPTANDINELKGEFSRLQLGGRGGAGGEGRNSNGSSRNDDEVVAANKMKGMFMSKIFSKLWSTKEQNGEISSSDTSESPGSASIDGTKSTPSRSRKE